MLERTVCTFLAGAFIAGALGTSSYAAYGSDASDFGTSGLIKMPNARMAADSTLRATIAVDEVANLYNITFQALPRVQATFRYAIFNPKELEGSRDGLRGRTPRANLCPCQRSPSYRVFRTSSARCYSLLLETTP